MSAVPPLAERKTKRQLVTSFGFVVGPPGGMPSPSRSFAPGYSSCTSRTAMFARPRNERVAPSPAPVVLSAVVSVAMSAPLCRSRRRLWVDERPEVKRLPPRPRGRARRAAAVQLPLDERDERPRARDRDRDPRRAEPGIARARRDEQEEGGLDREPGEVERAPAHRANATRTGAPRARSAAPRAARAGSPRAGRRRSRRSRRRSPRRSAPRSRSRPSSAPA